ncbi:MAG: DUF4826 family protein [Phycisphaerae bacterium]
MDSDETPTLEDPGEAAWVQAQRSMLISYLATQNVDHAGVSLEPRWFVSPYIAIWAVRSKVDPDRIGWWAISGDVPTDHVACTTERDDADVLLTFARRWKTATAEMAQGNFPVGYKIGLPGQEQTLAPLLLKRAETLEHFAQELKADL